MVSVCFLCKKIQIKKNPCVSFFRFPKDENRLALWFKIINVKRLPKHTAEWCYKNLVLCSGHFSEKDIKVNQLNKRLHPDAIPILHTETIKDEDDIEEVLPFPATPEPFPGSPEQLPDSPEPFTKCLKTEASPEPFPGSPEPLPDSPEPFTKCLKTEASPEPFPGSPEPLPDSPEPFPKCLKTEASPEPFPGSPEPLPDSPEPFPKCLKTEASPEPFPGSPEPLPDSPERFTKCLKTEDGMGHAIFIAQAAGMEVISNIFQSDILQPSTSKSPVTPVQVDEKMDIFTAQAVAGIQMRDMLQPDILQPSTSDVSVQTSASLLANTPKVVDLRSKVKTLQQQLRRSQQALVAKPSPDPGRELTETDIFKFLRSNYKPELASFIKMQMNLLKNSPKGACYSNEYKQFALYIYFLDPNMYNFFAKLFSLPSKSSLLNITKKWPVGPGLNDFIFGVLKTQVDRMRDREKECVLCFGEMSLRSHLYYDIRSDNIIGFHETLKEKSFKPANNALVLMLRSIHGKWEQPLSYFFVNSSCPAEDAKDILVASITKLKAIGLNVRIVVSDQSSNFVKLVDVLGVTLTSPFFTVDDLKVFYMFDIPSLLNSTRDHFFQYGFEIGADKISKEYLNTVYSIDKTHRFPYLYKLTDAHINPNNIQKTKVKYAAQVFSAKVAALLNVYVRFKLASEAMGTVHFIDKMDKLFDIFNSSKLKNGQDKDDVKEFNRPFAGARYQVDFLKEMRTMFENVKIKNWQGIEIWPTFMFGWQLSISAFLQFWDDASKSGNVERIFTRKINQECLGKFFREIRQQNGNCRNPTPIKFSRTFKKMFGSKYFDQAGKTNGVEKLGKFLSTLTTQKVNYYNILFDQKIEFKGIRLDSTDYRSIAITRKKSFYYVGLYFMNKCWAKHSCDTCIKYARENQKLPEGCSQAYLTAYTNAANNVNTNPNLTDNSFFTFFGTCENIFVKHFKELSLNNVAVQLWEKILSVPFNHPCNEFPKDYFASLFVRTRIFYTLKFLNSTLKDKRLSEKQKANLNIIQHL